MCEIKLSKEIPRRCVRRSGCGRKPPWVFSRVGERPQWPFTGCVAPGRPALCTYRPDLTLHTSPIAGVDVGEDASDRLITHQIHSVNEYRARPETFISLTLDLKANLSHSHR